MIRTGVPAQRVALIADGMAGRWWHVTARPLDAARDALIALQGQLIAMLAASNAALAERVTELEERLARLERTASRNSGNSSLSPSMDVHELCCPARGCA
jgi:Family of unknown function (DUF6444)